MAELLEFASPLPALASNWRGTGLSMTLCPPVTIWQIEGPRDGVPASSLPLPGRCLDDGAAVLLSVGQGVYLRLGDAGNMDIERSTFRAIIDMSSAWTHFSIEGPNAVAVLRKGCAVDLHPRMFPAGACAATGLARLRVALWRPASECSYHLLVGRSHALSLWSWLIESALEYGGERGKERVE